MKVLVTGGAGFIGSTIAEELLKAGHEVFIVDNLSTGKREYVPSRTAFFPVDLLDSGDLSVVFKLVRPNVVIHQAAQVSVPKSLVDPCTDADINISGTLSLLKLCEQYKTEKIIFASSAAVYGNPQYLAVDEEHPLQPESFYGLSKLTGEHYIRLYSTLYGIDYSILRYANVFGPKQDPRGEGGVISIFMDLLKQRKPLSIYGDGEQTRDFIYVKDIAAANLAALSAGRKATFNIGTNTKTSLNTLVRHLEKVSNTRLVVSNEASRPGDILHSQLDNTLATQELNWTPQYTLEQGLAETYTFYNHKNSP
ncbi:NAD-dependent epimerase/dehydratase family protein [Mesobacillus selenatarsenatis]|uniref:UDP-glucose 4-epimerase n=1 Tax=Mesobacillus selenatarsenatis (strain DSM 18680 / JCM 14380 / FERM P-15431 / SF-1) TaxID=1321606 RepID=A0A0A8X645_MESS1|nr:NAD-dependent epimerase/dehydratase family protein [Mesobacillus selenatarsenatis]GAM15405.1 UDP-glucose 4-epimerase [Mesobacillus selenatarsenatis SF-1]